MKIEITTLEAYAFRGGKATTVRDLLLNEIDQPMSGATDEFLAAEVRFSFKSDLGIGALYEESPIIADLIRRQPKLRQGFQVSRLYE